jgi:hypothetical protein
MIDSAIIFSFLTCFLGLTLAYDYKDDKFKSACYGLCSFAGLMELIDKVATIAFL